MYSELLQFDLTYSQLYEMTLNELIETLENRRQGLGYRMWKQAYLNALAQSSGKFPSTPEDATPELYPPKKSIPMPSFLKEKWLKKGGFK